MSGYQPYVPPVTQAQDGGVEPSGQGMELHGRVERYPEPVFLGRPEHPQATGILVLGILSLVVAGILGPFAWHLGNKAIKECEVGAYTMSDKIKVGRILGIIATIILLVGVVFALGGLFLFMLEVSVS